MKKEEIFLGDWQRILIGNAPWEFMLEVFLRTLVIYLILLVVLRFLGKRMSAQLTIMEMAVMITLGAIISVPMQLPDRGLLPSIVVLLCTLLFQRGLGLLSFKYKNIELKTQGKMALLVADGCLMLDQMEKEKTSREQVFAQLRCKNVQQLGQVKRLYLEACGYFSLYKNENPSPGLSILPMQDQSLLKAQPSRNGHYACQNCGKVEKSESKPSFSCHRCGSSTWIKALDTVPEPHSKFTYSIIEK